MRPLGVTLVGFYQILRGLLALIFGLSIMLFAGLAAKLASMAAEGNMVENLLRQFGHAAGIGVIVFALVHIVAGYGVLRMQNWARLITLLFSAVGLALVLIGAMHGHVFSLIFAAINAASIFYLALPPVRRAFLGAGNSLRMAA